MMQQQQQRSNNENKENQNKWEEESISEEFYMESQLFNYDELKRSENFGIKKY